MLDTYVALILFLLPLAYSPGPGNLFFMANGARFGVWATVPANLGYHLATFGVTLLVGVGVIHGAMRFPDLFLILKGAGAAYVAWLGWRIARAGVVERVPEARGAGFWDGFLLLLLNPKGCLIMLLMFSQFAQANVWGVSGVFTLNNMLAFMIWTVLGDRLACRFRQPESVVWLNTVLGGMLIAVAVWMLWA